MDVLEKANELIDMYLSTSIKFIFTEHSIPTLHNSKPVFSSAIELSLLTVNQLLERAALLDAFEELFWIEVKEQLINIKHKHNGD